jgi:hypothetical protein
MHKYRVQISERWDYLIEANSEAAAAEEAGALRDFGIDSFGAKHAEAVYDLGTKVLILEIDPTTDID